MKKILSLFLASVLCLCIVSCKDSETEEADYVLWESTAAAIDGFEVDFSENSMKMSLAIYNDGIYLMSVEIDGEALENFPQEGSYTEENGVYTLQSGWVGTVTENKMELSYSDETNDLVFHCVKS